MFYANAVTLRQLKVYCTETKSDQTESKHQFCKSKLNPQNGKPTVKKKPMPAPSSIMELPSSVSPVKSDRSTSMRLALLLESSSKVISSFPSVSSARMLSVS